MKIQRLILVSFLFIASLPAFSQLQSVQADENNASKDWEPVAEWPFAYPSFRDAVIYTTVLQTVKAKANMHLGSHYVWYESKDKRLEVKKGIVKKVVFDGGDTYYPVNDKLCLLLHEDTIDGKLCRMYMSHEVDRDAFNEMARRNGQAAMSAMDGLGFISNVASRVADSEGANILEQQPLPMVDKFYFLYDGDVFEATETNILKHLAKQERVAYRSYTRKAEVLSGNRKSMEDVWFTFFVSKHK